MTTLSVGLFFSFLMYIWGEKISIFDVKIFDVLIPYYFVGAMNTLSFGKTVIIISVHLFISQGSLRLRTYDFLFFFSLSSFNFVQINSL